jgi:tetratricopeptide (TPR) repeat protein
MVDGISNIADTYYEGQKTEKAIELYQHILSKYPSEDWGMWALTRLARCYILRKEDAKAESVIEKLLSDYSNNPEMSESIYLIAELYEDEGKGKHIELYQHILSKYPSDHWTMNIWDQFYLATYYLQQNEDAKAESAVKKLMLDHCNHPDIGHTIGEIINANLGGKINPINQKYILDNWIKDEMPLQIQKIGLLCCIEHFYGKPAYDALDKFMAILTKYPNSMDIVNEIANGCYEINKYEITVKMYQSYLDCCASESNKEEIELKLYNSMYLAGMHFEEILISLEKHINRNKETNTDLVAEALVLRGQIFIKLGEVGKAVNEFLILKNKYPETKEFPEANFFVGYCYMLQGKFDQAKEVFNLLIKDYPLNNYTSKAKLYLTRIESMTE